MAGGYGGQEIALDVNDAPLDITSPLAKVQALQTAQNENQYRSALTDAQTQRTTEQAKLFPYQLQATQNESALNTASTNRQLLSRAMASIDPNDPNAAAQWDASMRKLADQGVTDASQYIGRYSPDRQQRLVNAYGADNAMSSLAGIGVSATPDAQLSPEQTQGYDAMFSKMNPDQLKSVYGRFEQIKDALNQVAASPNPAETWAKLAPQFGHNEPFSWQSYKNAWSQVAPLDTYLRGRMTAAEAGAPNPILPGQIVKGANGETVRVDSAGNVTPITAAQGKWTTNASGVETNSLTGETRDATSGASSGAVGPAFDALGSAAVKAGASGDEASQLRQLAWVESRGIPGQTSATGRKGLIQLSDATFARFGGGDINSIDDQAKAGLGAWREAVQLAARASDGTPEQAYVVYQQGVGGGPALLRAAQASPDTKALAVIRPFYKSDADAKDAITKNGGSLDMSAADFVQHIGQQWDAGASGVRSAAAQGVQFPKGYDEPTFQNLFWEQAINGKEPTFTRGPGGSAGIAQAAYRKWQANFMRENELSPADMKNTASMAKAIGATQAKVMGLQSQVETSERTASDNADLMLSLAPKGAGPTSLPALNSVIQAARKGVGDPSVVKFDAALGTFLDEYAKVMTSSTGTSGVTSDSARAEAYSRLSKFASQGQLQGGVQVMKQEMANRGHELDAQMTTLQQGMSQLTPRAGDAAHAAGAPAHDVAQPPSNPTAPASKWPGFTEGQLWRAQQFRGAQGPAGTQDNPMAVGSIAAVKAQAARLGSNAQNPLYFIDPFGNVKHFP